MGFSQTYVHNIRTLYRENDNLEPFRIWQEFERQGKEFLTVDWKESERLARKFHAQKRQCFDNCRRILMRSKEAFSYYEGYATAMIPVEHAWLVNPEGVVIDPTFVLLKDLDLTTADYFGVELSIKDLLKRNHNEILQPGWLKKILRNIHPVNSPDEKSVDSTAL